MKYFFRVAHSNTHFFLDSSVSNDDLTNHSSRKSRLVLHGFMIRSISRLTTLSVAANARNICPCICSHSRLATMIRSTLTFPLPLKLSSATSELSSRTVTTRLGGALLTVNERLEGILARSSLHQSDDSNIDDRQSVANFLNQSSISALAASTSKHSIASLGSDAAASAYSASTSFIFLSPNSL